MGAHLRGSSILIRRESKGDRGLLIIYHVSSVFPKGGGTCEDIYPPHGTMISMFRRVTYLLRDV